MKIEPTQTIFKRPRNRIVSISQYGFNFIIKNYSLEFLMTGKLCAIFTRKWFKETNKKLISKEEISMICFGIYKKELVLILII